MCVCHAVSVFTHRGQLLGAGSVLALWVPGIKPTSSGLHSIELCLLAEPFEGRGPDDFCKSNIPYGF